MGGWENYHAHLDRANTLDPKYWKHTGIDPLEAATYNLKTKQNLVGELHKGLAYTSEDLEARMSFQIEKLVKQHTRSVYSMVDCTADIVRLSAVETLLKLKEKFKDSIRIKVGTQPIFGFKNPDDNPERWEIFREGSRLADFIGGLPEKDASPTRVGYNKHMSMVIKLAIELGKEAHLHVDQANTHYENGTETLIEAVKWLGAPLIGLQKSPTIWAVHVISPSCYDECRFKRMLEGLKTYNIGVICCPRAALTMRQLRPIQAPTHNSIARILEMIKCEIPLRIGTDNIADIFIPTGDGDMLKEIPILADSVRYYNTKLWAKLGCGETPNDMDRELVSLALYQENEIFRELDRNYPLI
jgi:cytosine/adenosine deaminase-related metal-dependent hydrolase